MFLKQSDKSRYGNLLKEFRQSYANKQWDLYPEDISSMFEVMRTVEGKCPSQKKLNKNQKKESKKVEEVQLGAESFAQTGKEKGNVKCHCCGKLDEYLNECKIKKEIDEKDWFKNTGKGHYKSHGKVVNQTQVAS